MDGKKGKISIVIPVYNEENNIDPLIQRIEQIRNSLLGEYEFEVLFVNDGSEDNTYDQIVAHSIQNDTIKLLDLSKNFGNQIAVTAGINESSGDAVITMDGDLQHPPETIHDLLQSWEKGAEVVQALRSDNPTRGIIKRVFKALYFFVMRRIANVDFFSDVSDFRLMDRVVVDCFNRVPERVRFVRGIVNWLGFSKDHIEYTVDERISGKSTFTFRGLTKLAVAALTSFCLLPLQIASLLGLIITVFSLAIFCWMVIMYLFVSKTVISPVAFFTVLNAILGGLILLSVGLVSLYVGNILEEVKGRPLYVVRKRINFDK